MTKIEWTHRPGTTGVTWNPVTGCTKISAGCTHCYAERMSKRLAGRHGYPRNEAICPICGESYDRVEPFCPEHPNATLTRTSSFDVTLHPDKLDAPLHWKKPRTVFVCSMGDLFHENVPFEWIGKIWSVMERSFRHTFMVLTKRPERLCEFIAGYCVWESPEGTTGVTVPDNIWLGVTAENQKRADERIPLLLQCPAAVHYVSVEPMLGPVNLKRWIRGIEPCFVCGNTGDGLGGDCPACNGTAYIDSPSLLDWVILGPETGPGAREMPLDSAHQVRDQCIAAGVPFFFKRGTLDGQEWKQWPQ